MVLLLYIRRIFISLNLTLLDLSTKNLAFHNGRLSRLSEEELFKALGPPNPEKLARLEWQIPRTRHPYPVGGISTVGWLAIW